MPTLGVSLRSKEGGREGKGNLEYDHKMLISISFAYYGVHHNNLQNYYKIYLII